MISYVLMVLYRDREDCECQGVQQLGEREVLGPTHGSLGPRNLEGGSGVSSND